MIHDNTQADKVALVTGASRRIGAAIAKKLHQSGFRVALHCHHSLNEAKVLAGELNKMRPDSACVLQGDLRKPGIGVTLIQGVTNWAGRLDLLVNNAAIFVRTDCKQLIIDEWQDLFTINVQAPFALSLAAFSLLARSKGGIINITDIHAEKPLKDYAIYCQTKAALLMQTKALAREFAPEVRVNAVAPGAIAWPEEDNALSGEVQRQIIAKTPLQRHGEPLFIAEAVMALVSNSFITGQVLNVDGGRSIT
ncbi:MAG: pteridine reductase [Legionella sp.]|nr:pteridine reductase [Legionella sp.]